MTALRRKAAENIAAITAAPSSAIAEQHRPWQRCFRPLPAAIGAGYSFAE
jgi:hypothetical protein